MHGHRNLKPRRDLQISKRKCGWLGHTPQRPVDDITRQTLEWNPQGKRSRGRPKNTWRRTVLEKAKGGKKTWAEIKCVAKNRVRWRNLVDALCSAAERWDYWLTDNFSCIDFKCQITLITLHATLISESNLLLDLWFLIVILSSLAVREVDRTNRASEVSPPDFSVHFYPCCQNSFLIQGCW